jgi:hypothetical protein
MLLNITLPQVPSLEVGELLIRSLYQAKPQLDACSQQQLLELVTLADSLDAKKAVSLASSQLQLIAARDEDELEWGTVVRIMSLPPACPEMPAYKPLYDAAANRIQDELGDLEAVCFDVEAKWQKLLGLPHMGLQQLLSNRQTRVASENTVVYVIQQWADAQQQQQQPSLEQMQQLCETIRMQCVTPLYFLTVFGAWPLLAQCFTAQEHAAASMLTSSVDVTRHARSLTATLAPEAQLERIGRDMSRMVRIVSGTPTVQQHQVWLLPRRLQQPKAAQQR